MLFRMIYDDVLAQASYLVGCQRTGEAIVIDPERDVDRYIELADRNDLSIVAATETHIHADFLSGVRELAERTGAHVYLSAAGGEEWSPRWLESRTDGGSYPHTLLTDGDIIRVGHIELRAIHTPGHTPEHLCFVLTDMGGGASDPMGIFTGDFVFVGDVGRPDLLETAMGVEGAMEPSARALFASVDQFKLLPEYLQVWPAHGAGSACGKALGAVPQSTVGYEKRFNPAIRASSDQIAFVDYVLTDQPEPPLYFSRMKTENRDGPRVLGSLPQPQRMDARTLASLDGDRVLIVDTRPWPSFREGSLPGSIWMPPTSSFLSFAGSFIENELDVVLVTDEEQVETLVRLLVRIGIDRVTGYATPEALAELRDDLRQSKECDPGLAAKRIEEGKVHVLDVRRGEEFAAGHIDGATHIPHTRLKARMAEAPTDLPLIINCRSGVRSAVVASYMQGRGYDVTNLAGGFLAWDAAGLETVAGSPAPTG